MFCSIPPLSQDMGVTSSPALSPANFETNPADALRIVPLVRLSLTKIWFSSPPNQHQAKHNSHRQSDFHPRCKRLYLQSWNNPSTMPEAPGINAERMIKHQEPAKSSFIFTSFISSTEELCNIEPYRAWLLALLRSLTWKQLLWDYGIFLCLLGWVYLSFTKRKD